jgi:hypothetical protein
MRYYPGICLQELRKTIKTFCQDSLCTAEDLAQVPLKYT